jgi:hypothetical protein
METRLVADPSGCGDAKPCPKIRQTADGRYWLRGNHATSDLLTELDLPDHEGVVELDPSLIGWTPSEDGA